MPGKHEAAAVGRGDPGGKSSQGGGNKRDSIISKLRTEESKSLKVGDIHKLTPEEVFAQYDTDGSGLIEFDEFCEMLPALGVNITKAKAKRYFRVCDTDGSENLDQEEFKSALFACDPENGNTLGFSPKVFLTPLDAFEMFDEDCSGGIDETEFADVLDYLGVSVKEAEQEAYFKKYCNEFDILEYQSFRKIWLSCVDVREELKKRGVEFGKKTPNGILTRKLEEMLILEEAEEEQALAQAQLWRKFKEEQVQQLEMLENAKVLARRELEHAMDTAGQVYLFGSGSYNQFHVTSSRPSRHFKYFERLQQIWKHRVQPTGDPSLHFRNFGQTVPLEELPETKRSSQASPVDRSSQFQGIVCASNTAALWGRGVLKTSLSENCVYAVTDDGSVLAWGGKKPWWTEMDSEGGKNQKKKLEKNEPGRYTARSKMMLLMTNKQTWQDVQEPELKLEETENEKFDKFKFVTKEYYNVFEACPAHSLRMEHMLNIILPRVTLERVKLSLSIRGIETKEMNKIHMFRRLYDVLQVEKDEYGTDKMDQIRKIEQEVLLLKADNKDQKASFLVQTVEEQWRPLQLKLSRRDKDRAEAIEKIKLSRERINEHEYAEFRKGLERRKTVFKQQGDGKIIPKITTARGACPNSSRKWIGVEEIAAGPHHAAAITQKGQLFTWGDSNFGRLGHGIINRGFSRKDCEAPQLLEQLATTRFKEVACSFSHNLALSEDGHVYSWGSSASGKLGVGVVDDDVESFAPHPVALSFCPRSRIINISCGNVHSAAVTSNGHLFVWGCGDSGRLGLGKGVKNVFVPTQVTSLAGAGVKVAQVSCGSSHTAIVTRAKSKSIGKGTNKVKFLKGGHVYVAGPSYSLGRDYAAFHLVEELYDYPVKQIDCGYSFTAAVTFDGELYTWGSNKGGALGHPIEHKFVLAPKLVSCLYRRPQNLALGGRVKQSSTYNRRHAETAINGKTDGYGEQQCIHTQLDEHAYWEVDLGEVCTIEKVVLWNRQDAPLDSSLEDDHFTSRMFPCWLLSSSEALDVGLVEAYAKCSAKKRLTKNKRKSVWTLPQHSRGRYIRVQLEGTNYLHFAELQVFGTRGTLQNLGRVDTVSCGKEAMVAVIRPALTQLDIDNAYCRAVKADPGNSLILRQYPQYFAAYDRFADGRDLYSCPLDTGNTRCESCRLRSMIKEKLQPGPNGRLRRLNSISKIIEETPPPRLKWEPPPIVGRDMVGSTLHIVESLKKMFAKFIRKGAVQDLAKRVELELKMTVMNETEGDQATSHPKYGVLCAACDVCSGFKPSSFSNRICESCTHTEETHTRLEAESKEEEDQ